MNCAFGFAYVVGMTDPVAQAVIDRIAVIRRSVEETSYQREKLNDEISKAQEKLAALPHHDDLAALFAWCEENGVEIPEPEDPILEKLIGKARRDEGISEEDVRVVWNEHAEKFRNTKSERSRWNLLLDLMDEDA